MRYLSRARLGRQLAAQQVEILERVDRLVELNQQMWDRHLQFCGRLVETVAQTNKQLLQAQKDLEDRLAALRDQAAPKPRV